MVLSRVNHCRTAVWQPVLLALRCSPSHSCAETAARPTFAGGNAAAYFRDRIDRGVGSSAIAAHGLVVQVERSSVVIIAQD